MSSIDASAVYSAADRRALLALAVRSIEHGLANGAPLRPSPGDYPVPLSAERATFVTLKHSQGLRGCIGVLEAVRPLIEDVAQNAFAAAFEDPRFPRLAAAELTGLEVHLSVLSPAEPLPCGSEVELLAAVRPGIDGLILEDGRRRGTFLPAVWEQLPDPARFLEHLRLKAGLPSGHWSDTLRVFRYTTESFGAVVASLIDDNSDKSG